MRDVAYSDFITDGIVLQQAVLTSDLAGGQTKTRWDNLGTFACRVQALSGRENEAYRRIGLKNVLRLWFENTGRTTDGQNTLYGMLVKTGEDELRFQYKASRNMRIVGVKLEQQSMTGQFGTILVVDVVDDVEPSGFVDA